MTDPATIAANSRRLLEALAAWPSAPDNSAVLGACDAVKAANDPSNAVSRGETELADAIETAIHFGDYAIAWEEVQAAIRKSNQVMDQATRQAFEAELDKLDPNHLNAEHVDALAAIGRELNRQAG